MDAGDDRCPPATPLPLHAVRLTAGPFREAQQRDLAYVLALDVDRLAAPYRREAGLPVLAEAYGNWEGDGMGGHLGGHFLSAASLLIASTGDARVGRRLGEFLDELQRCHDARSDGFLGGVPAGAALAGELAAGRIEADLFDLNGRWVPLYNLHKTLSGLLDAVVHAGEQRALPLAVDLAEWWLRSSVHLDDAAFERVLHTEPGGMGEAFATLGALTGDPRHLAESRRFAHRAILDPLLAGRDALDGLHANTQIPKAVGYELLGGLIDDESLTGAAEVFWHHVVEGRSTAIGGNSVREHFHAADDFTAMVTDRQGPEGCNTVNMIELSVLQYLRTGRGDLVDYVERALFNHVLGSQHPGHGGLVYFTPLRPAHYRVYSQPATSMWCCVGSGIEAHARHGAFVAVRGQLPDGGGPTLDVLLYLGAEIHDVVGGLRVAVSPERIGPGRVTVTVRPADAGSAATRVLRLRRPSWSPTASARLLAGPGRVEVHAGWFVVHLDGTGEPVTVELDLPAPVSSEPLPDGSAWSAFVHGPIVLATADGTDGVEGLLAGEQRMGHVAAGPLRPLADTPVVPDPNAAQVLPDGRVVVAASAPSATGERDVQLQLRPFATIHDERYTVYWPTGEPSARRAQLRALDSDLDEVDVVDTVAAGEQQPESDHHFTGAGSTAGREGTLHWRSATGWFAYTLDDPELLARRLVVRHREVPGSGPTADVVLVDGRQIGDSAIDAVADGSIERTYTLPVPAEGDPTTRVVEFRALGEGPTRSVVSVTLLR